MKNSTVDVAISVTAVCLTLGIATGLRATPSWQQQRIPPVFRGGTTLVPLTVTVLDKKGNPVTDLTQADFTVLENKVRQDLRSFFPQPMTPRAIENPGAPIVRGAAADPLEPATRRTFLIALSWGRIQAPARALDGAIKFVRQNLLPQDLVAVMAFNRASEFTTDREQVIATLERYKREHERIIFEIKEWKVRHPRMELPETFQQQMDALFGGQPIRDAVELLLGMDGPRKLNEPAWNRQSTLADVLERSDRSPVPLRELLMAAPSLRVLAAIGYLRPFDGQKHLVWLGQRLAAGSVEADQHLAARANDARVIVDIIHTTGLPPGGFEGFAISSAQNVAEWTGGYYTGGSYADVALARVDTRGRFSYLLGYAPANVTLDGKYRQIQVQVNRPDVTVVFQHGYYATGEPTPIELRELVTSSRLASAGMADLATEGIKVTAKAAPISVFGRTEMRVDLAVDPARLSLAPNPPSGRVGTLDVQIFCGDAKETLVGELRRRLDLTFDEDVYQRGLKDPVPLSLRVPVSGPVKYVKVAVYDYAADLLGTVFLTLK